MAQYTAIFRGSKHEEGLDLLSQYHAEIVYTGIQEFDHQQPPFDKVQWAVIEMESKYSNTVALRSYWNSARIRNWLFISFSPSDTELQTILINDAV